MIEAHPKGGLEEENGTKLREKAKSSEGIKKRILVLVGVVQ